MLVVAAVGQQIEDQGPVSQPPQGRGTEQRTVRAVRLAVAHHGARRTIEVVRAVFEAVEEGLDLGGGLQFAKDLPLARGEGTHTASPTLPPGPPSRRR